MTETRRHVEPLEELQFALAEGDAIRPPRALVQTVLDAALATRAAGRPVHEPPPISEIEAFRRAVESLDRLLESLDAEQWRLPALRDLDVQGLVGHLTGVERDFLTSLHQPDGVQAAADHVASTDAVAVGQAGRSPTETLRQWQVAAAETLGALSEADTSSDLDETVALHGLRLPLGPMLVVRTFELWTHEEDIRRATARPLQAPDAASLRLMTELAVAMLPSGMRRADRDAGGRWARIVLTGPGGGTWQRNLGSTPDDSRSRGPADVRIVLDAVDFCRLVANRVDPATLATVVTGDHALAQDLFVGAASLALD